MGEVRTRVLREARAAARLNHPHIAAVCDVLEHPNGGGGYDPPEEIVKPYPVVGGPASVGGPVVDLDAKVTKLGFGRLFKHEIWLGPTAADVVLRRDPDIEIWP